MGPAPERRLPGVAAHPVAAGLRGRAAAQLLGETGLADAGLASQESTACCALDSFLEQLRESLELPLSPKEAVCGRERAHYRATVPYLVGGVDVSRALRQSGVAEGGMPGQQQAVVVGDQLQLERGSLSRTDQGDPLLRRE